MEGQTFDFCVGIVSSSSRLLPNGFVELRVIVHSDSATGIIMKHICIHCVNSSFYSRY